MDGHAVEGIFQKVRLDCKQTSDPALQLALLLHNPQTANEVFLLSLRDCVVTLPKTHPLRSLVDQKSLQKPTVFSQSVLERLNGPLKGLWGPTHAMTPEQRQVLTRLINDLESQPPYLDFVLLKAIGYLKLGNWARSEVILAQWLNMHPIDRIMQTPLRRDPLGRYTSGLMDDLFKTLSKGLEGRVIADLFFQGLKEFTTDQFILDKAASYQELDTQELVEKLRLRYHRTLAPQFADWMISKYAKKGQRKRFLQNFFERTSEQPLWVFTEVLPDEAKQRELLVKLLIKNQTTDRPIFYLLASDDELRGVFERIGPQAVKNLLKEKRREYLQRFAQNPRDAWALMELIKMGHIDEDLVIKNMHR